MAIYKPKKTELDFFKPDYYINYKAVDWKFELFNNETKEKTSTDILKLYSVINVKKFLTKDSTGNDFKSDIFENIFSDKIRLRNESYKYVWTYLFNLEAKGLVHLDWSKTDYTWSKTTTVMIWILDNGKTFSLDLWWGIADISITRKNKDKTNLADVKTFEESSYIELSPNSESIKVWTWKKTKQIFLINIKWDTRDIPDEFVWLAEEIAAKITNELERNQAWTESKKAMTEVPEDEISIEDLPF